MLFPQLENAKGQLWLQLHFAWANVVTIVIRPVHRGGIFWHSQLWCIPRNPPSPLPFPFGKHSHSSGLSSSTSFTLQVGKTSAFILHTATAVLYFSFWSQAGVCFNVALAMRNFTTTADTFLVTPYLRKAFAETQLLSCNIPPKKTSILKYVVHGYLGGFVWFFLSKSHKTPFPPHLRQEEKSSTSIQLNTTVVSYIQ